MALPLDATKVNFDAAADDPEQARAEFADHVDKFNALLTHLKISAITNDPLTVGNGLIDGGTTLDIDLDANPGLAVGAGGIKVDINGTTAKTAPVAADSVLINDVAGVNIVKKATIPNLMKGAVFANIGNVTEAADGEFVKRSGANYVGADPVPASSISQGKLKTTTETCSTTASLFNCSPLAGGDFVFWPSLKISTAVSGRYTVAPAEFNIASGAFGTATFSLTTSFVTHLILGSDTGFTFTTRSRYVQGSPPYDLGDGEVGLFIALLVDNAGNIIGSHIAPDPVWANNGPTRIRPDFINEDGIGFLKVPRFSHLKSQLNSNRAKKLNIQELLVNTPEKRARVLEELAEFKRGVYDLIEIDQEIKNADMNIPGLKHPLHDNPLNPGTLIYLDPVSKIVHDLNNLHEIGEDVAAILHDGYIKFDNVALSRSGPEGIMIVTPSWKP